MIETNIVLPKMSEECKNIADGYDVFHWPEFINLAKRLGVALDRPIRRLVLDIEIEKTPRIYQEQLGADAKVVADECVSADTTTIHNDVWRTKRPLKKVE